MFQSLYTTSMSSNKKALQLRFYSIRRKKPAFAKWLALLVSAAVLTATACATLVMAAYDGWETANGSLTIDGKTHAIEIVQVENSAYLPTDSYYIPLRAAFERLGCRVNYGVPESAAPAVFQSADRTFPFYAWEGEQALVTDNLTMQLYGATTGANANMPIIEIVSPGGEAVYCQVASCMYSWAFAPPVILMDGTAYLPIRALAYYVGGDDNVQWDGAAHDTYYEGVLTWDAANSAIVIDPSAKRELAYKDTLLSFNTGGRRVMQHIENRDFVFCLVKNGADDAGETVMVIDKHTGQFVESDRFDGQTAARLRMQFTADADNVVALSLFTDNGQLTLYKTYQMEEMFS